MKIENTTQPQNTNTERGDHAYVNLVQQKEGSNFIGFATVYVNGFKIRGIRIFVNKDGDTYLRYPSQQRKDAQGNAVKGDDGYDIYDEHVAPCTRESRQLVIDLVDKALDEALSQKQ